jgi:DNA invertase Pin-like site-specific DNA recombinase
MRAAIYARVSTMDQHVENQLAELRQYVERRGWTVVEYVDALRIAFVTLGEGLDTSTPAGRLQLHVLSAIAEFERARVQERVVAGLARARAQGRKLGRPEREMRIRA